MMTTMLNLLAASHQGFFYPVQASTIAREVDPLAWFIHGVTIFFTLVIVGLTIFFAIRYRESVHPVPQPPGHNNILEVAWTAIPAVVVFICFFWGFRVYMRMNTPKPSAEMIEAVGQTWFWSFVYRNPTGGADVQTPEMYLPLNTPVQIKLRSPDVLHSLYLPALRMKKDVVPGRFNEMYLEATLEGTFDIYCAEYCGDSHSQMLTKLHVLKPDDYRAKLIELSDPLRNVGKVPDAVIGQEIAKGNGCFSCHSVNGAAGTGPTWLDLYGVAGHEMADGSAVTVDDNYILESIRNPNAKVRKGFGPPSAMNPFTDRQLPDEQIKYVLAYMKSISKSAPKDSGPAPTTQGDVTKAATPATH